MKKIICKVTYDTETASVVQKNSVGVYGDSAGYEETLMQTPDGKFFLYTVGGPDSPYPEEGIARMGKARAEAWMAEHN